MNDEKNKKNSECAMLTVGVTTACGVAPISGATVTVSYNGPPGSVEKKSDSSSTDENGITKKFHIYSRRARIGNKYVNLPRFSKCDILINADGYVPLKAKEVPIFPEITVHRSFDLIPLKEK